MKEEQNSQKPAIWWITQDLRLSDNPILYEISKQNRPLIPLFILDPRLLNSERIGPKRRAFLYTALQNLDKDLQKEGGRLVLKKGLPGEILREILEKYKTNMIYVQESFTPFGRKRQEEIRKTLPLKTLGKATLRHPEEVLKKDGSVYTVFTPYMKAWKSRPYPELLPAYKNRFQEIPAEDRQGIAELLQNPDVLQPEFEPSEEYALKKLNSFSEGENAPIYHYKSERDLAALDATSMLSAHFHFGLLSARQAVQAALKAMKKAPDPQAKQEAEIWLNELIWREFYNTILYRYPAVLNQSFRPEFKHIAWENNKEYFRLWCEGKTGYPFVDAGLRQLLATGWMHNRLRMVTASFLVKNLLINWQWGEEFFLKHLVDADPAANNGGWQWTAGTGTDAAPYFRVFNPVLQGKKFDPQGSYIRTWVPELENLPERYIHTPWEMSPETQEEFKCRIGIDYAEPVIDLKSSRQQALEAFKKSKSIHQNLN